MSLFCKYCFAKQLQVVLVICIVVCNLEYWLHFSSLFAMLNVLSLCVVTLWCLIWSCDHVLLASASGI